MTAVQKTKPLPLVVQYVRSAFVANGIPMIEEKKRAICLLLMTYEKKSGKISNMNDVLGSIISLVVKGLDATPQAAQIDLIKRGAIVCVDPSFRGIAALSAKNGITVEQVVRIHEGDAFSWNPTDEMDHKIESLKDRTEKNYIGGYVIYSDQINGIKGKKYTTQPIGIDQILKSKECSTAKNNGPWKQHFLAMCDKTVIRQALKMLGKLGVYGNDEPFPDAPSGPDDFEVPKKIERVIHKVEKKTRQRIDGESRLSEKQEQKTAAQEQRIQDQKAQARTAEEISASPELLESERNADFQQQGDQLNSPPTQKKTPFPDDDIPF